MPEDINQNKEENKEALAIEEFIEKKAAKKNRTKPAKAPAGAPAAAKGLRGQAALVKRRKIAVKNRAKTKKPVEPVSEGSMAAVKSPAADAKKEVILSAPAPVPVPAAVAAKPVAVLEQKEKISRQNEVVKEIFTVPPPAAPSAPDRGAGLEQEIKRRRSIKLYRKIAYVFIALTLGLLGLLFYLSFVKLTIILIPNQERVSNNMIIDIIDSDQERQSATTVLKGVVKLVDIEHQKTYPATGAEVIGEEAVGRATIINNYDKNQPLVATTRLLTPDNKLFRLGETVNVPARGSVEAAIYADKPSADMAIGPVKFSIPGLWAGLQDKIYAESKTAIVYQQKLRKHITAEDIDNSKRDLKQELLGKAKTEVQETYQDFSQIIYKIDEDTIKSSVEGKVDDKKEEFSAVMQAKVAVVAFNDKEAASLAKQKFLASLADNKELISFDESAIIYTLNNYDYQSGAAAISATFEGKVSLREDSSVVELDKILGLNSEQLNTYLSSLPEIAGYEVKFFPAFIKRVPKLVDRIEVVIRK
ncbi:MAG: hypothetical protein MUC28_01935 [Planctomycetes bacterium]|jgi:hypothetical protein|nr:hypothetical protein [Planctomycetota bacterium]